MRRIPAVQSATQQDPFSRSEHKALRDLVGDRFSDAWVGEGLTWCPRLAGQWLDRKNMVTKENINH
jgi:hypothetical protein